MTTTPEQIISAADTLDALLTEQAWREIKVYDTNWYKAINEMRQLAEARKRKPAKVYAVHDDRDDETSVYIEKPDGRFVAVYVGPYSKGYFVNEDLSSLPTRAKGGLAFGGDE